MQQQSINNSNMLTVRLESFTGQFTIRLNRDKQCILYIAAAQHGANALANFWAKKFHVMK